MPTITITISDELSTRLRTAYGTLTALQDATREQWRQQILETYLNDIRTAASKTAQASVESQVKTAKDALEGLL